MLFEKQKETEEQKARQLAKQRERQRKSLIRTKYGQKQKKHAKKGVESCLCAVMSCFLFAMIILNSFANKGEVGWLFGLLGLLSLAVAIYGFSSALRGFRERDKNYVSCKWGMTVCGLVIVLFAGIFFRGLF